MGARRRRAVRADLAQAVRTQRKASRTHAFDAGAAWQNLALQGARLGYAVHGMEGFDAERAAARLGVPPHYAVQIMGAIGVAADPSQLPDALRRQERPNGRRPLDEIHFAARFPADPAEAKEERS